VEKWWSMGCVGGGSLTPAPHTGRNHWRSPGCAECRQDTQSGERLECWKCGRKYHWWCFRVQGMPSRLGEEALQARRGDCRRPDFVCEGCHFREHFGREPGSLEDYHVCLLDRMVTIDEYHRDASSTAMTNFNALRQVARWGADLGVPMMLAGSKRELAQMPEDHRAIAWFLADKSRSVKFNTLRRFRAAINNYYLRLPGMVAADIPTASVQFTHRFDGMIQRLGLDTNQAKVFGTRLLEDMTALLEADWARARGEGKVELAQANLAFHLYFAAGLRANEAFSETAAHFADNMVTGDRATSAGVGAHLWIRCSLQTKEERVELTELPVAYSTAPGCPLEVGKWATRALAALEDVGRGASTDTGHLLFASPLGVKWVMGRFWRRHVVPRLEQLQREGLGGLSPESDLEKYGSNSPRRTWDTMAAQHPNPVSEDLRERQGRWRKKQKRRQRVAQGMASLYFEPDLSELLRATYWLSRVQ